MDNTERTTLMPFVTQEHRDNPDREIPGDLCYMWYKWMVDMWKQNPRWTTAHLIYKKIMPILDYGDDDQVARSLAWQVFFQLHVMEYERRKRDENGDI